MAEKVPSIEELGLSEWFPEGKDGKAPRGGGGVWGGRLGAARAGGREAAQRKEEYTLMNGMLFLSFVLPALFAKLIGQRLGFFHYFVYAMVHEAGHMLWGLFGWRFLGVLGGTLNEMIFSVGPALICLKEKATYPAAFIFLMCAGLSIQNAGWYMMDAAHPSSYGFGTGRRITAASHDWTNIFSDLGINLRSAADIGTFAASFGHALAVIFLLAAAAAFAGSLYGWEPDNPFLAVSPSAAASFFYFLYVGAAATECALALALAVPFAWARKG